MGLRHLKLFLLVDHLGAPEEQLRTKPLYKGVTGSRRALRLDYIQRSVRGTSLRFGGPYTAQWLGYGPPADRRYRFAAVGLPASSRLGL